MIDSCQETRETTYICVSFCRVYITCSLVNFRGGWVLLPLGRGRLVVSILNVFIPSLGKLQLLDVTSYLM